MTDSESNDAAATARAPRQFFHRQLAGEQSLSFETATQLYQLAMALLLVQPWEFLEDQELILVRDTESGDICYCSIMGALGEVFSLHVYAGAESYRSFRTIATGKPIAPGDFFASMRGVCVEFVTAKEQTAPDRELLEAFGHPKKRGKRAPIFRAYRPGYHPWYITESEGRLLVSCLSATLAFCDHALQMDDIDYWKEEDVFPFIAPIPEDKTGKQFKLDLVRAPAPPIGTPQPAELDENLIAGILHENLPRQGTFETDHFFTDAVLGEANERKTCVRTAMVSDADSGLAMQPVLGKPEDSTGQLLVQALLGAMRDARCVPVEVRVRHKESKILLSKLSERLGFQVRVVKSLPALDDFKDHLLEMMEGSGEFSGL